MVVFLSLLPFIPLFNSSFHSLPPFLYPFSFLTFKPPSSTLHSPSPLYPSLPTGACELATPCKNGATCVDVGILEYKCVCATGYEGRYCHIRSNYGKPTCTC